MQPYLPRRRGLLLASLAVPALQGCASPLTPMPAGEATPEAVALLGRSAVAHGSRALAGLSDISVSYLGEWPALIDRLQPALVDKGFRGGSEERLLLRPGLVGQEHRGPMGRKMVSRREIPAGQGEVRVWFNGEEAADAERRAAAALVVDGYGLFLMGPMSLARLRAAGRPMGLALAGTERVDLDGVGHDCDVLRVRISPGLGFSEAEDLALFIDRGEGLMRRVRFSLNGLESTRGAVAEVDLFDFVAANGLRLPTRFHERLLRPLPLPVHDWRLTGLDLDRGMVAEEVAGPSFLDRAARPAAPLGRS
ncbi:hypothetical protein D9599_20270 [Roseomonas sp. KE2513]|uniref:hypothetical protein n=1 Tax=Roseomonas sp. KE2513 TaxID=2479202 RepID=UPI0018DF2690|nr:hypothetical protein [Roseomonas sp. KE2513]MBI0537899.1 hypothetical protein [Roseomonas sp. KE2513]